jgi:hypothetical protein
MVRILPILEILLIRDQLKYCGIKNKTTEGTENIFDFGFWNLDFRFWTFWLYFLDLKKD